MQCRPVLTLWIAICAEPTECSTDIGSFWQPSSTNHGTARLPGVCCTRSYLLLLLPRGLAVVLHVRAMLPTFPYATVNIYTRLSWCFCCYRVTIPTDCNEILHAPRR